MTFVTAGRSRTASGALFREGRLSPDGHYFAGSTGYGSSRATSVSAAA